MGKPLVFIVALIVSPYAFGDTTSNSQSQYANSEMRAHGVCSLHSRNKLNHAFSRKRLEDGALIAPLYYAAIALSGWKV
jgi:hypothetical protein